MTYMQAVLGLSQLQKLDHFVAQRREIAAVYNYELGDLQGVRKPFQHSNALSSWHLYILRFNLLRFKVGRKQLFETLRAENIGVNVHYIPVYTQTYY